MLQLPAASAPGVTLERATIHIHFPRLRREAWLALLCLGLAAALFAALAAHRQEEAVGVPVSYPGETSPLRDPDFWRRPNVYTLDDPRLKRIPNGPPGGLPLTR